MRVAVVGAGLAGITTAHELTLSGHEVTVYERRASVAEEASFAPAGIAAAGLVAPWAPAAPWWREGWERRGERAALEPIGRAPPQPAPLRASQAAASARAELARTEAIHGLLSTGIGRLDHHHQAHAFEFPRGRGMLVIAQGARELAQGDAALEWLRARGEAAEWADARQLALIEPAMTPLVDGERAAWLPLARAANPREWVQLLRAVLQQRGAQLLFQREVIAVEGGRTPHLVHAPRTPSLGPLGPLASADAARARPGLAPDAVRAEHDAIVLCTGADARGLLDPLGLKLPWVHSHACTVTAPAQVREAELDPAPRAALFDLSRGIAIGRMGARVRVAGPMRPGPAPGDGPPQDALKPLYAALDARFPGAVNWPQAQVWQMQRAVFADGWPAVGAAGIEGLWINLGHAHHGWALGHAAAWSLARQLDGDAPAPDAGVWAPQRLRPQ